MEDLKQDLEITADLPEEINGRPEKFVNITFNLNKNECRGVS